MPSLKKTLLAEALTLLAVAAAMGISGFLLHNPMTKGTWALFVVGWCLVRATVVRKQRRQAMMR